ncbi:MAG: hypothetical protein JWR77_2699 [Rhizorhabdus sp.]|nr:hypothetical protein [Rhizorhabdus sp.]
MRKHSRILVAALAATSLNLAPIGLEVANAIGLPMVQQGIKGKAAMKQFLADYRTSLGHDPTGNTPIRASMPGYTPLAMYRLIQLRHPELGLPANPTLQDLKNLAEYLGTLELKQLKEDQTLYNSRMVKIGDDYTVDPEWIMKVPKGTWVWADRNTGIPILKWNCGNVLGPLAPKPPPCPEIDFEARELPIHDQSVSVGLFGDFDAKDGCFALQGPNDPVPVPLYQVKMYDCKLLACDMKRFAPLIKQDFRYGRNFKVVPGHWRLFVSKEFAAHATNRAILCKHSDVLECGIGVQSKDYNPQTWTATIAYDLSESHGSRLYWPQPDADGICRLHDSAAEQH